MEFTYSLDKLEKPLSPTFSQGVVDAIGKKAIGTTQAENLLGEPESPEIKDIRDAIESQAETSLGAVAETINCLNAPRELSDRLKIPTSEEFINILDIKLEQWQKDGSLKWCNEYIKQNGGDISLVAMPNTQVTLEDLAFLARNFGQTEIPPAETYVFQEFWEKFSSQELSGPQDFQTIDGIISNVRLSLIPCAMSIDLRGTVEQQKQKLQVIQFTQPNIQVPSPLDSVVNWYALRSRGVEGELFNMTCVRHFNIGPKETGYSVVGVPDSFADNQRNSHLDYSNINYERGGRVAVG